MFTYWSKDSSEKYTVTIQHAQTWHSILLETFSGRKKTRKLSLCLPYPNLLSGCALFHCEVNAENMSFFYYMESTYWKRHIFVEVSGDWNAIFWWINSAYRDWMQLKLCSSLGLHRLNCSTARTQSTSTGPSHDGETDCWFSSRSRQQIWIRIKTFPGSLLGPLTLISPRHTMFLHSNCEMDFCPWERPLLPEEPTDSGGPNSGQLEGSLAFFQGHQ